MVEDGVLIILTNKRLIRLLQPYDTMETIMEFSELDPCVNFFIEEP